ncbi:PREDICTED: membrane-spanning 4-domains subfamily A member 14-like [Galeopterus variegatus]|uniref:Membrane-spanning 4-domains subfamily A member 14-like n=1 Tax=Galeopterus variegatus TaxID=482537 RepID=A0ABM0RM42_GALVR|nr:PREDICTED: membrane-spanning 4-domains subfamily A member 14-like [Galeopterus variegatus]
MESSSQDQRATHVITIQPKETVLTAFPYKPHSSLLDFLKGEPKLLGAVQILLALIIVGLGAIFAFNYINFSHKFPLVFLSGYPFWGAFIFILTGYLTGIDEKSKKNVGILSILLIISIAELSISVTVASFRSKCWTSSDEIVFFLPSDVTQNIERPAPEEIDQLQFELQEESSSDNTTTNAQTVFFGGYVFFKLRVSKSPLPSQSVSQPGNYSTDSQYTPAASVPYEQQKRIASPFKFSEEEIELKHLPPILEKRLPENIMHSQQKSTIEKLKDKNLQSSIVQPPQRQTQLLQDQGFPIHSVYTLQTLPPGDLPSQALPVKSQPEQAMTSKSPKSHVKQFYDLTSENLPSQDICQDTSSHNMPSENIVYQDTPYQSMPSQHTSYQSTPSQYTPYQSTPSQYTPYQSIPSQDMLYQNALPDIPTQAILSEARTVHQAQFPNIQHLPQQPLDPQPQNEQFLYVSYQNIRSEVMELTQEWKSEEELHSKKFPKRHSLDQKTKDWQPPRRHSSDRQSKGWKSPKRKSLDQQIKDQVSSKRHSIDKQAQYNQTIQKLPDQQVEDWQSKGGQFPKQKSRKEQVEDQMAEEEQSPKKQTKDQRAQEEKSPKGQSQNWQAEGQQAQMEKATKGWESQIQQNQDLQSPQKLSPYWATRGQDWRTQDWINKNWKARECQLEMQHSLNREPHAWQTQDVLEKEVLEQKALYQEAQTQHTTAQDNLHQQLQNVPFQGSKGQDKNQQDFQSRVKQKEDMQGSSMQTRDIEPKDKKYTVQKPRDLKSEDMKLDFHSSFCQSSVQDTYLTYLSDIDSEHDMQQSTVCPNSYKEMLNVTSTSFCPKDQQQSEDSD